MSGGLQQVVDYGDSFVTWLSGFKKHTLGGPPPRTGDYYG